MRGIKCQTIKNQNFLFVIFGLTIRLVTRGWNDLGLLNYSIKNVCMEGGGVCEAEQAHVLFLAYSGRTMVLLANSLHLFRNIHINLLSVLKVRKLPTEMNARPSMF